MSGLGLLAAGALGILALVALLVVGGTWLAVASLSWSEAGARDECPNCLSATLRPRLRPSEAPKPLYRCSDCGGIFVQHAGSWRTASRADLTGCPPDTVAA